METEEGGECVGRVALRAGYWVRLANIYGALRGGGGGVEHTPSR